MKTDEVLPALKAYGKGEGKGLVSEKVYREVVADRPKKLTESQVGFKRGGGKGGKACGGCFHHYISETAGYKVCEIFRPKDDSNVEEGDACAFWNTDGKTLPLLNR